MSRPLLVLGGQGFLGRHVVDAWLSRPGASAAGVGRSPRTDRAFSFDVEWSGERVAAPLPPGLLVAARSAAYRYERCDLTQAAALRDLLQRVRPAAVVHSAAALRDSPWPQLVDANVTTVVALVEAVASLPPPLPRVVLVSSGSVYGPDDALPFREGERTAPFELYGVSKRAGEDAGRVLARGLGVDLVRARVFNLVGPGLQDRHLPAALARRLVELERAAGEPVLRLGPLTATRDFVDVRDAARALLVLLESGRPGRSYNVASGVETPVRAVLDELLELTDNPAEVPVETLPGRPLDLPRAWADVSALRGLGWSPRWELRDSLSELVSWYRALAGDQLNP